MFDVKARRGTRYHERSRDDIGLCSKQQRTEICLESHEALAAADQRNATKFRDVIELMRAERQPAMAR